MTSPTTPRLLTPLEVQRYPYPIIPGKRGLENAHCFGVAAGVFHISIMYCRELLAAAQPKVLHISVCCSLGELPVAITSDVIHTTRHVVESVAKLEWPVDYEKSVFDHGPFAGYGVHLWELGSKPA